MSRVHRTPTVKAPPVPRASVALALPMTRDLFSRGTYVPGDGDVVQAKRPGAEDHLRFRSRVGNAQRRARGQA